MHRLRLALIGILLLLVSAVTSFGVVALFLEPDVEASTSPDNGPRSWNVATLQDAEAKAGYSIASPESLPEGLTESGNIIVSKSSSATFESKSVQQFWHFPDDPSSMLMLDQSPNHSELGDGEAALISGVTGERKLLPAVPPGRPRPMLVLFWKENGRGYALVGALGGEITENVMLAIADKVSLPSSG